MKTFPHHYPSTSIISSDHPSILSCSSDGLESLELSAPPEFDGPDGHWSPETLLSASISSCFILSFKALANMKGFEFTRLECHCDAQLEKTKEGIVFTQFELNAILDIPHDDSVQANTLLEKAKSVCLITASLKGKTLLTSEVRSS